MTTGFSHDLLLLCAAGDTRVVQGLATKLGDTGSKAKVQTVSPHTLAADFTAALEQAPLVLLAVSARLLGALAALLAEEMPEASAVEHWLVLQLDDGEIEGIPAAVEVIAWPRQLKGEAKKTRQASLARILELAGATSPTAQTNRVPEAATPSAPGPGNSSGSNRDNFNKEIRLALSRRVGDCCSKPGCRNHTSGPHSDPGKVADTGVAAHITAAAPGGPRYDPELTSEERSSADNGIWLCQNHAKLIDSDSATYPEALLKEWKAWAESEQKDRQDGIHRSRSDWTWPGAWDFGPYRKERRQGFVGRDWLLRKVRGWAADPEGKQALLIGADFGVGKTAFLAKLLDQENELDTQIEDKAETQEGGVLDTGPGLPVVAQHFCNLVENSYLSPGRFVQSLAAQLKEQLPAYRKALEDDSATSLRESLNRAEAEPLLAFQQAVVAPLDTIPAPATWRLLVVDALDEALDYRPEAGGSNRYTIVDLLAKEARNLPTWLRVLATSRRHDEVLKPLREGFFSIEEINAEEAENLADIHAYVQARCEQEPLTPILSLAGLSASDTADVLQAKSGGKFLYAVRVLNDLASGALTLENRQSLDALPPGMDGFYKTAFERRFPDEASYAAVQPVLALLCEQREPLGSQTLASILALTVRNVSTALQPLNDLLRLVPVPDAEGSGRPDVLCSFDHLSLEQWLSEENQYFQPRAGRFGVDREVAAEQIRTWGLAEIAANRAHTSSYLVRHLANHLNDDERAEVIAGQLRQFHWLQARLRLAGLNALLGDFEPPSDGQASLPPELQRLGRALRQAAHVLSHKEGWNGEEQLASQLLARLVDDGSLVDLRMQVTQYLYTAVGGAPRAPTLGAQEALLRTLLLNSESAVHPNHGWRVKQRGVTALAPSAKGILACGCSDGSIRLWDLTNVNSLNVYEGHTAGVTALSTMADDYLASGSCDGTIRIWNLTSGNCTGILRKHCDWVTSLAVLHDGRLASGSTDHTIRLWDPTQHHCTSILKGHTGWVNALLAVSEDCLATGSSDGTIRLWDPASGACTRILMGHTGAVHSLARLANGHIASGSKDKTIRLWDPNRAECSAVLRGHEDSIFTLAVLGDNCLASGSRDHSIRLWNLSKHTCNVISEAHEGQVTSLHVVENGRLLSSSNDLLTESGPFDSTIRLWDPSSGTSSTAIKGHNEFVNNIAVLVGGLIASSSRGDKEIKIWNPISGICNSTLRKDFHSLAILATLTNGCIALGCSNNAVLIWSPGGTGWTAVIRIPLTRINMLASLSDNHLVLSCSDLSIRIWNLVNGESSWPLVGHEKTVNTIAVLADGTIASGSDDHTIRIWDPNNTSCNVVFKSQWGRVTFLKELIDGRIAFVSGNYPHGDGIYTWDPATNACKVVYDGNQHSGLKVERMIELGNGILAALCEYDSSPIDDGRQLRDVILLIDPLNGEWNSVFTSRERDSVRSFAALSNGRFVYGLWDRTLWLWDPHHPNCAPRVLFVADAAITALAWVPTHQLLVAGDASGRLHWLEMGGQQR